ncbi:membrane bound O-acyl transferase family-domain-containing protein [Aspergillus californicus]
MDLSSPWAGYALSNVLIGLVTAFTARSSLARPAAFMSIVALAISLQSQAIAQPGTIGIGSLPAILACTNICTALDLFFHSNVTYDEHIDWLRTQKGTFRPTMKHRVNWALQLPFNSRRIGTKWQISQVPPFDAEKPKYTPSRTAFLLQQLLSIIISGVIAFFFLGQPSVHGFAAHFTDERQKVMLDGCAISLAALPSRIYLTVSFLTWVFTIQHAQISILAFIAVSMHVSDPVDWPPVQGPISETWSNRQLWGATWHQGFRQLLSANANFAIDFLGLQPGTITTRYTRFFLCFLQSGALHTLFDQGYGIPLDQSGALVFFAVQPIAFAVEDLARWTSRRYGILANDVPLRRLIGYTWVLGWCTITWPIWAYPLVRRMLVKNDPIPFVHLKMTL